MEREYSHAKTGAEEAKLALLGVVEGDEQDQESMVVGQLRSERREIQRLTQAVAFEDGLRTKAVQTVARLADMGCEISPSPAMPSPLLLETTVLVDTALQGAGGEKAGAPGARVPALRS